MHSGGGLIKFFIYNIYDYSGSSADNMDFEDFNAITVTPDQKVYAARNGLAVYDIGKDSSYHIGWFPPGMTSAGDLTFRAGKLYLSTTSNQLVEVNEKDPSQSRVYMDFPVGTLPVEGLGTYYVGCDSLVTYAVALDSLRGSIVYEINMEHKTLTERCRTDLPIIGAASYEEHKPPACQVVLDLDADNSSGALYGDYRGQGQCVASRFVTDRDVNFYCARQPDSLVLEVSQVLDGTGEYLVLPDTFPALKIIGNGSTRLVIRNAGGAGLPEFNKALAMVRYENAQPAPAFGVRKVRAQAFAGKIYQSRVVTAWLPVTAEHLQLRASLDYPCDSLTGASVVLQSANNPSTIQFTWQDGQQASIRQDLQPGWYPVLLTDSTGCSRLDSFQVQAVHTLEVNLVAPEDSVCGRNGRLSATVTGGRQPYQYRWSNGNQVDSLLTGLPAGDYRLTVSDASACTVEAGYRLFQADTILVQHNIILCAQETYTFESRAYTRDTSFCKIYSSMAGCDSTVCIRLRFLPRVEQSDTVRLCAGEIYTYGGLSIGKDTLIQITATGINGCDSLHNLRIQVESHITKLDTTLCPGDSLCWNRRQLTEPGIYTDTIRQPGRCDSMVTLTIGWLPKPLATINRQGDLCTGKAALLASGGVRHLWNTGDTAALLEIEEPGLYTLQVTDANGCKGETELRVSEAPIPEPVFSAKAPTCSEGTDGTIQPEALAGYRYKLNEEPLPPDGEWNNLAAGSYTLVLQDAQGRCRSEKTIVLTAPPALSLSLDKTQLELTEGDTVQLSATAGFEWKSAQWLPEEGLSCVDCLAPLASPGVTTIYELTLTDDKGCQAFGQVQVAVTNNAMVYAPNAFSPNGDGNNDFFMLYGGASLKQILLLEVFDRWGNALYTGRNLLPEDVRAGWDGKAQGRDMPSGVYAYRALVEMKDGRQITWNGLTQLIR